MLPSFTDQMGRSVELPHPPLRIISLVPSQTELLFYLGLDEEVVGITKFCPDNECRDPDKQFRKKPRIGGTKQFNMVKIAELQPDLIIGNLEENEKEQMEVLFKRYPVWMSDIKTLEDALDMIEQVGLLVGKTAAAQVLQKQIKDQFLNLKAQTALIQPKKRVAYFIWRKPYMLAASDTFIDQMLHWAGFENAFHNKKRYPIVNKEDLQKSNPDVILLSSEPFPFSEKHFPELHEICPKATISVVDGEMFSWYGNRLLHAPAYFSNLQVSLDEAF